ncbi:MAG: hypothetical protein GEV03_19370 [Streptosporangiales bacterium]|nr:hypothetical protein [Streptosporangiales bacterium]
MTLFHPGHHARLVAGLRALADFLETRPELPAPLTVDATVFVSEDADEAMRAEVERVAAQIGSTVDNGCSAHGHYRTSVAFGPVQYRAVAVLASARARYDALLSYSGAVVSESDEGV